MSSCFCLFVNSLITIEKLISFLGTLKEYGTSIASYVLMGLLKGVKYSLSNFLIDCGDFGISLCDGVCAELIRMLNC